MKAGRVRFVADSRTYQRRRPRSVISVLLALLVTGCGGYMAKTDGLRKALGTSAPNDALAEANKALGVDKAEALPRKPNADTPLLLVERATILQALGRYKESSRDFQIADKQLDVLDLTDDATGKLAKYLFSDDATIYKAAPYEKLLLNTVNMINYLARGESSGAMVEARRFLVNRRYLERITDNRAKSMLALGSYLCGIAFEMGGEPQQAIRHYGDALDAGGVPVLSETVASLMSRKRVQDGRFAGLRTAKNEEPVSDIGYVLVIVQAGMTPYKIPERLPIGAAIVASSDPNRRGALSPADQRRAQRFALKGVLKWVNYPKLVRGISRGTQVSADVEGQRLLAGVAFDAGVAAKTHHDEYKAGMIAAAIVRLLTRAIAGGIGEAAGKKLTNSGIAGLLIGLAVEGAMTAADTPDTRSWVTLPRRFWLAYGHLNAGEHLVRVRVGNQARMRKIAIKPGQISVVNVSDIR
ncbi:MAG: hypothetical protein VYA30_04755 [Myxococcota bacterium]|nr:hypothetical protein [Myxococcota bacterium]